MLGIIYNNQAKYYQLLREVNTKDNWQAWFYYMLEAVEHTATKTTLSINNIIALMDSVKIGRSKYFCYYSKF